MVSHQRQGREWLPAGLLLLLLTTRAAAVTQDGTIGERWPGYTEEQARRGQQLYAQRCAECHGPKLEGASGPALSGPGFAARWADKPAGDLQWVISRQMPLLAPNSLTSTEALDIHAFVLSRNGYSAGPSVLSPETLLTSLMKPVDCRAPVRPAKPPPAPRLPAAPHLYAKPLTDGPADAELLRADPANWLMYNKDYRSQRYSALAQITAANAHRVVPACAFQLSQIASYSASPVVYEGTLYVTAANTTYAIDARNCRTIWQYDYVSSETPPITVNRGVAVYKGAVIRTMPAGHLIALDAKKGSLLWDIWVANVAQSRWLSAAPVVYQGKIFIGEPGADFGVPAHMYAFDNDNGRLLWSFDFIPTGNQPGAASWQSGAPTGGGSSWSSYTLDPVAGLIYVPVGNPAPDYNMDARPGDNLYTDSVLALQIGAGKLSWYAQQIPHDFHDWDTAAAPVLYDQDGRQFMAVGGKGGWLYIYDRATHALIAQPEVTTHSNADVPLSVEGVHVCPGSLGGVSYNGPAYSPQSKSLYVNSIDWCGVYKTDAAPRHVPGTLYYGGSYTADPVQTGKGWVRSFDAATGRQNWAYESHAPMFAGITPTAGGVVMTGDLNGDFLILSANTGELLYRFNTGGSIAAGVSTYLVDGRQYVAVASGNESRNGWSVKGSPTVFVFALPQE